MPESEKVLEKKLAKRMDLIGGWAVKLWPMEYAGLPDRLCLFPEGPAVFAEVKTTGKKPTKIQLAVHRKLRGIGFDVWVLDSSEKIEKMIQSYA